MESNDRRERQSNPQGFAAQSALYQQSSQLPPTSAPDRFRVPAVQQSSGPTSTGRRARAEQYGAYGFGDGQQYVGQSMQAGALQYATEYGQDANRSQQQQQQQQPQQPQPQHSYGHYGSGMMYNVLPQHQQTASPTSPYEQTYQQQRPSAGIDVLPTQFGVPQQYYVPTGEAGSPAAPPVVPRNNPSHYSSMSYTQQSPVGQSRMSVASAYESSLPGPSTAQASSTQYAGQTYAAQSAPDTEAAYSRYQAALRTTNESAREGRLSEAQASLMEVTEWLLGNAEALNLVRDDEAVYDERLRLWEQFNNCWLVTLQKQSDMTTEAVQAGRTPQQPQSLISAQALKTMGNELVRLCDTMEKHGLVDYQLGVWEEHIIDLLVRCIDKLEEHGGVSTTPNPGPTSTRRR